MHARGRDCWPAALTADLVTETHHGRVLSCYPGRPRTLSDLLERAAERAPDRDAVVAPDRRLSWRELRAEARRTATALHARHGVEPGDRVALLLLNGAEFCVGVFACALLVASSLKETSPSRRLLEWRPLVVLGTFSYSFYLVHAPLLQILWQYLLQPLGVGHEFTFLFLMSGGLGLVIAATYAFFVVFEKPFLGRRAPSVQLLPVRSAITQ